MKLTANKCKFIAVLSMITDHIGAVLFPREIWLRYIGRAAFPIFIFFLIEGFFHTKNRTKYLARLLVFSVISEIPFNLAFSLKPSDPSDCNVYCTLALGLISMWCFEKLYDNIPDDIPSWLLQVLRIFMILGCFFIADFLNTDYGASGVLAVLTGFALKKIRLHRGVEITGIIAILVMHHMMEIFALLALPVILCYNGKLELKSPVIKWFFYLFYPVHLVVLYLVSTRIMI